MIADENIFTKEQRASEMVTTWINICFFLLSKSLKKIIENSNNAPCGLYHKCK